MSNKNAVAKQDTAGVPAEYGAYADYAGQGFGNTSSEDYSIPFMHVLQANSKQVELLEGAKAGMIINTVTNDLFKNDEGIEFIPATTQHVYVEWVPRDAGGGFVAVHQLDSDVVAKCRAEQEFGKFKLPNGNDLIETFYVYGILVKKDGSWERAVIAFASTKIKKYKSWMSKARTIEIFIKEKNQRIPLPLFAHKYQLKTVKEKNNKGEFWNWQIAFAGGADSAEKVRLHPSDDLFQAAVGCLEAVEGGTAKAAYDSQSETGAEAEAPRANTSNEEEPPY